MKHNILFLFTFFLVWLIFAPTSSIITDSTINGWIKNAMILIMFLYFLPDLRVFFKGEYKRLNIAVTLYCCICIISVLVNIDTIAYYTTTITRYDEKLFFFGADSPKVAIYYSLSLLALMLFLERVTKSQQTHFFLDYLHLFLSIELLFIDYDALTHKVYGNEISGYLLGTKFSTCYFNLFYCIIYYLRHPKLETYFEKVYLILILCLTYIVSVYTQCSTMIVCSIITFFFIFFYPKHFRSLLSSGLFLVVLIVFLDLGFFFASTWLLEYSIVQDFVVDILSEDMTLTGRIGIYATILGALESHLFFGYGFGNSSVICMYYGCGHNPQNGLIEIFLNVGVLGTIAFLFMLFFAFHRVNRMDWYKYPIMVAIVVMAIISTIEVPFDKTFIFFIMLLILDRDDYRRDMKQISAWTTL